MTDSAIFPLIQKYGLTLSYKPTTRKARAGATSPEDPRDRINRFAEGLLVDDK